MYVGWWVNKTSVLSFFFLSFLFLRLDGALIISCRGIFTCFFIARKHETFFSSQALFLLPHPSLPINPLVLLRFSSL